MVGLFRVGAGQIVTVQQCLLVVITNRLECQKVVTGRALERRGNWLMNLIDKIKVGSGKDLRVSA